MAPSTLARELQAPTPFEESEEVMAVVKVGESLFLHPHCSSAARESRNTDRFSAASRDGDGERVPSSCME